MANQKHLEIFKQGVEVWNRWRKDNPAVQPDLSRAKLNELTLRKANLMDANLSRADFSGSDLWQAQLRRSSFYLSNLSGASLVDANFKGAYLRLANLREADLSEANLRGAMLRGADLYKATLKGAYLVGTNLGEAILNGTDFKNAWIGWTIFAANDLSVAVGLDSIRHFGPSTIGVDTLYLSHGNIPSLFLRNVGVPDTMSLYVKSLTGEAIDFHSCFISYSSRDQLFVDQLYADLQGVGVRCWFAPEDLKIGAEIRRGIDESIRVHDKLLLVLSKSSVKSDWVEEEVETALEQERKEKRTVLFPIRVDDAVMRVESGWPALVRKTRNIGDFRKWKNHDSYQKAFDKLLHSLKEEDKQLG